MPNVPPSVDEMKSDWPPDVAKNLSEVSLSLGRRYNSVSIDNVWQSPPKFDGSREWRATIYINSVITHWRYSNSRRKWLRSN